MISFYQKDVAPGEILFRDEFHDGETLKKNWHAEGGQWEVRSGALYGAFRGNDGGLIFTKEEFPGNVMLDYFGTMLSPCDNDLNFLFRSNARYDKPENLIGYVGGLNGWWLGHAGIERYPFCNLAMVVNFHAEADREYRIQTGIVDSTVFLAVDGRLLFALHDPEPVEKAGCDHVGLGTYCSRILVRDFKVCRPVVTEVPRSYTPKF